MLSFSDSLHSIADTQIDLNNNGEIKIASIFFLYVFQLCRARASLLIPQLNGKFTAKALTFKENGRGKRFPWLHNRIETPSQPSR